MNIKKQLVTATNRVFAGTNPVTSLTFHETDNYSPGADAQAHADLQSSGNVRNASWHYQGDDKQVIQSFRDDQRCWHAGDGSNPAGGNYTSLAYEICVNPETDFATAVDLAAQWGAQKLQEHGLTIDDVEDHNHWSNKNCPSRLRSGSHGVTWNDLIENIKSRLSKESTVSAPSRMVSPVAGYLTQAFKPGRHLGMDIGTGGKKVEVRAAFAGTVTHITRGVKHGNRASTWAPGRTSNAPIIRNVGSGSSGDGEYQAYGHVTARADLKVGDFVQAGEVIGTLDNSGNWTGWHLHLELWNRNKVAYNPILAFNRWGIKVGAKPKVTVKPKPKPSKPKPKKPKTGNAKHRAWQERQNRYGNAGLYIDGINGKVSKNWRAWTKKLQGVLPAWKGVPKLVRDGDYASKTNAAVKTLQLRNGLHPDGFAERITIAYMRSKGSPLPYRPSNRP